jgi:serine/threonine-protein kinase PpkA
VLIADSDPQYCRWLSLHLQSAWPDSAPDCRTLAELQDMLPTLATQPYDVLLLGAAFATRPAGNCEGYSWLRRLHVHARSLPVIALANGGNELSAVKALRLGACDYLPRSGLDPVMLEGRVRRTLRQSQQRRARAIARAASTQLAMPSPKVTPTLHPRPENPLAATMPAIPHYLPILQIGDSSRASVWLAHSESLGRNVALKVSKPPTGSDDDHAQSFAREYAALSALRHPGVVQIFEYGMHEHCEFLAMEYFPCGDLKQRLQQPITPEQSVEYVRRIAMALQPVHAAGLMHRDLKPPNVMLRPDCSVVLIDFGLAKRENAHTSSTELGIRRGSPYYMSPEQVQGLPLDSRSDLYSLGVIFYEMLTGRKPYTGTTALELMDRHVSGDRPALPAEMSHFEPLLQTMMAIEREDRVANAGALLEQLRDYQPDHFDLGPLDSAHAG